MRVRTDVISKYAWAPIPIFILLILGAEISGNNQEYENKFLIIILNLVFNTLASIFIINLISRSFLITGKAGLALIGCGVIIFGFYGISSMIFGYDDVNESVTITNLCIFLSALFFSAGAVELVTKNRTLRIPGLWLTILYFIATALVALIILFSHFDKTPIFFFPEKGGTPIRLVVLSTSIILFAMTGFMLWSTAKRFLQRFVSWYSLAMWFIAIGIVGLMLEHRLGDVHCWIGRSSLFLSGIYMFVAGLSSIGETNSWVQSIEHELGKKNKITEVALQKTRENLGLAYAEAEYRRQELNSIFDNIPVAIWVAHDAECRNITGNRYSEVLMKVSSTSNISVSSPDAAVRYKVYRKGVELKPEEMPAQQAISTSKPVEHEILELRFVDGRSIHLLEGAVPRYDETGKVCGAFIVGVDISRQIKAEEDLQRSRDKLRIALENANTGIWQWNLLTGEMQWDERMEKMFDLMPGTFEGTLKSFEELVHEEDLKHVREAIKKAIDNDMPFESVYRTRSSQNQRYISARANIYKDADGTKVSLTGVCFDVTGMMERSNQVIMNLNEDLLKSNKELENFAYVASHDLQEPLRMVTSFTQLLQLRYHDKLDDDANTYINYAVEGSKRMYDLLNGLLAYSRVNTRQKEFSKANMNLIVENAIANLRLKIEESQAEIIYHNLPVVRADQNQMVQLMQNLIDNGIKFSTKDPVIHITALFKNGQHEFSVKDNGIGIEKQYFERIFRIFQRLHLKSEYAGMGIGLSICHRIVERHKGQMWVESEPGKGSTFSFSIPK